MSRDVIIDKYLSSNKILLAVAHLKDKKIDLHGFKDLITYDEYFNYIANYFGVYPTFIQKGKTVLNTVDMNKLPLEIIAEYVKLDGSNNNYSYNLFKYDEDKILISVSEEIKKTFSYHDKMTNAISREYIDNRAKNNLLTKTPFLLMLLDIDNFKEINDHFGQSIGDMILIELVGACKQFLGTSGAISRIGGDKFLVIREMNDDYESIHNFLFEFKLNVQKLAAAQSRGIPFTITIGTSRFPYDGDSYELLNLKAEKALIRGKNKGRDCFIIYLVDKCGEVNIGDTIDTRVKNINSVSTKNNIYSVITEIHQILSYESSFDIALDKTIALIGDYLYIDRVTIARLDLNTKKIFKHHAYFNRKATIKHQVYCQDDIVPYWHKALGEKHYVRVDDASKLDDNHPLKELFPKDHTTASISIELLVNNIDYGVIRFDMTTGARHWQAEDFQILLLVSQLITTFIQKNYLQDAYFHTIYFDPIYNVYNFTKFFKETSELLLKNGKIDYTIIDFTLDNMLRIKYVMGEAKIYELVHMISNCLDKFKGVIYGKKEDDSFNIFIPNTNQELIDKIGNTLKDVVHKFAKKHHFNEINIIAGAYMNTQEDDITLIEAKSNATFCKELAKPDELLMYSNEIREKVAYNDELVLRIDDAIKNHEFLLYLQPKISAVNEKLVGAEALVRWNYNDEKLLYPNDFIELFEKNGVIEKLDYEMFENVCKYQRSLIDEGLRVVPISVNVSRYVSDFDLYFEKLEAIRKKYGIDASYIEFEVTEGMYYENLISVTSFIDLLHEHGYRISMDDFGTGYSNLVSLVKLDFDTIKFDRSLSMDLDNDKIKMMLVKLIEIIKSLNKTTICEGVETKESVEFLTKIGCDSIQGYYYSKPITAKEFKKKYYEGKEGE